MARLTARKEAGEFAFATVVKPGTEVMVAAPAKALIASRRESPLAINSLQLVHRYSKQHKMGRSPTGFNPFRLCQPMAWGRAWQPDRRKDSPSWLSKPSGCRRAQDFQRQCHDIAMLSMVKRTFFPIPAGALTNFCCIYSHFAAEFRPPRPSGYRQF
jgi:hypothetical protein